MNEIKVNKPNSIKFPLTLNNEKEWNKIWPILNKKGYIWADGEEIDDFLSDMHDFPVIIDIYSDNEIYIKDDEDDDEMNEIKVNSPRRFSPGQLVYLLPKNIKLNIHKDPNFYYKKEGNDIFYVVENPETGERFRVNQNKLSMKPNTLKEVEYKDIFKPETMAALKGKSGESLRQMAGDKNLMQTLRRSQELLSQIIEAEADYHTELELIAKIMATDAYPIIDYANIKIDAKIDPNDTSLPEMGDEETPSEETPPAADEKKRRIINGITQGSSIRGSFGFLMFREYLDDLDPALVDNYSEVLKTIWATYDDENAIAMMLAAVAQNSSMAGGQSDIVYDEEKEQFIIRARAICFPILLHEIIKGLYEIVGTEGFGADKERNKQIISKVDKISNEPHDLQYGKFIYDGLNKLYAEWNGDDARVRELFIAEVYKLEDEDFFPFIENIINDTIPADQKKWAIDTMNDIARDLGKDDTGLEDLDEIKITPPSKKKPTKEQIKKLPILDLKIGKYDLSKGRRGVKISPDSKWIDKRTKQRALKVFNKLEIKPEEAWIGWLEYPTDNSIDISFPSTFIKSSYNGKPIIIAQTQTEHGAAGQIYIYSETFKSGKGMRLPEENLHGRRDYKWQDNSTEYADSDNITKEQILQALNIE